MSQQQSSGSGGFHPFAAFQEENGTPAAQPDDELRPGQVIIMDGEHYIVQAKEVQAQDAATELQLVPLTEQPTSDATPLIPPSDELTAGSSQEVILFVCLSLNQ